MATFYVLGRRHLEEVEGELFKYDYRFFLVDLGDDIHLLFDRATGTHIAGASKVEQLYDQYDELIEVYDKIVKTPLYQKNLKKFNKYKEKGKILSLSENGETL